MSDPRRLIDEKPDPFEDSLLRSARRDGVSARGRARTMAALGLGASALGTASTGTAATGAAASSKGVVVTWLVIGMLAGGGALGVVELRSSAVSPGPSSSPVGSVARSTPPVAPAREAASSPVVVPTGTGEVPERGPLVLPTSAMPATAVAPAATRASPVAPTTPPSGTTEVDPATPAAVGATASAAPTSSTLTEELALLDEARGGLARGDATGALATLDRYQQRFPRGTLALEAQVLRIDALWRRGDQASARQLAERFVEAHPSSPHSPRLRAMIGP